MLKKKTFFALLAICAGNSPVPGEFPVQRPVTRTFGVFFDLCLNKRLRKRSWGWWFESLSRPLWRHCNAIAIDQHYMMFDYRHLFQTGMLELWLIEFAIICNLCYIINVHNSSHYTSLFMLCCSFESYSFTNMLQTYITVKQDIYIYYTDLPISFLIPKTKQMKNTK